MTEGLAGATTPATPTAKKPWLGRAVLYGLPVLMALCVLLGQDYWPFTTAELFSRVRTNTTSAVQVRGDLPDGSSVTIAPTVQLGYATGLPAHEITPDLCRLWAEAGEVQSGEPVANVRAYRVVNRLTRTEDAVEWHVESEDLVWSCDP